MQTINGIDYLTAGEALARRIVNKAEYERWIYGGLPKKQHDHMIALALESNRQYHLKVDKEVSGLKLS